ncbi:hypothetical protein EB796_001020 [Bugula neritina]|uniref:Uncharacterized protein n=1 Tax=Bugula neritina TaxID=10212 RepID=A0A7J7KR94_BUGNE|nr:hypothetical protein EB796_001020 [Bugula neritina]
MTSCVYHTLKARTWHDAVTNCETKDMILYTWTGSLISFPYARGFWSGGPLHQTAVSNSDIILAVMVASVTLVLDTSHPYGLPMHWEFEQIPYTVNQLKITKVEYNLWTGLCHDFNFEAPMDYPIPQSYFAVVNGLVDTSYSVPDLFSPELECNVHIDTCQLSITWLNGVNNYNTTEVNFQCLSTTWIGMAVAFDLTAKKLYIFSSSEGLWNEMTISDEVIEDVGAGNITFNNRIVMKCVQYFDNVFLTDFDLQKISLRCFGKTKILKYKI